MKIELDNGKYTYIFEDGKHCALRYGEEWRNLTGDKFIYAMACEIERLQEENEELKAELENYSESYLVYIPNEHW
jgi:ubiquinone biosynthesis protein UbiJ